jgi:hypothetical protein
MMPSLRSVLLLCWFSLAQAGDVPFQLDAVHFAGNAGRFNRHPVQGHTFAMVLFFDADTGPVMRSEFEVVARMVAEQESAASKLMVGQVDGDLERNNDTLKNFQLKKGSLPFIAWLTRGEQDWEHRRITDARTLLKGISKDLGIELDIAKEEIKVHELTADNLRGHAGKFTSHPVRGHYFAAVLFYDSTIDPDMLEDYQVAARAIARSSIGSKVMMGQMNTAEEENKDLVESLFGLKQLPFLAWLEKGQRSLGEIAERKAEDWVAGLNATVLETQANFDAEHDEL